MRELPFNHFPTEMISTKLELATNLLTVLHTIEPGLSKFRAKIIYEVIDTSIYIFSKRFQETGEANIKESHGKNFLFIKYHTHTMSFFIFTEFVELLDEVLNIFNILGTSSPFEKMIHTKSSYLRKPCKEMATLGSLQ